MLEFMIVHIQCNLFYCFMFLIRSDCACVVYFCCLMFYVYFVLRSNAASAQRINE